MSMMNFDAGKMVQAARFRRRCGHCAGNRVPSHGRLSPLAQLVAAAAHRAGILADRRRRNRALRRVRPDRGWSASRSISATSTRPAANFDWYYVATAFGVAALAMIAFQAADIYQVQAFRSPVGQCARLTVAWAIVFLLDRRRSRSSRKLGEHVLARLARAAISASACSRSTPSRLFVFGIVRRWTREGRLDRRTVIVGGGEPGEHLVDGAASADEHRRAHRRRVRRPRRRALADRVRRLAEARHGRRSRRVRPPHPRRSRDLLAADLGRRAASCRC